jgi:hypothetical protein
MQHAICVRKLSGYASLKVLKYLYQIMIGNS